MVLMLSACQPGGSGSPSESASSAEPSTPAELPTVVVGSANFDESAIVAEMYAQVLEAAGFTVERNLFFGPRETTLPALESGELNLMPEYIGGMLNGLEGTPTADSAETHAALVTALEERGLTAFDYSPGQDGDGWAVRAETADEFSLVNVSDLTDVADQLIWGLPPECAPRPQCGVGLNDVYGIDISTLTVETVDPCSTAVVDALDQDAIDVGRVCTTQPQLQLYNLEVLTDDGGLDPAQNIAPVATADLAEAGGDLLASTLNAVSAELETADLIALQVLVTVEQGDLADEVTTWLEDHGLL
jgi:osmoprotectant transport system substrate-binding protein